MKGTMAKIISKNKESYFNYEIIDKYEAGIELKGWEVKSIRANNVNLKASFCSFKGNELFVSNIHINLYMSTPGDETAPRKLLLHKAQLKKLKESVKVKGYTVVPLVLKWSSKGYVKIDIALGKGKSKVDKRQTIKRRDEERRIKRYY